MEIWTTYLFCLRPAWYWRLSCSFLLHHCSNSDVGVCWMSLVNAFYMTLHVIWEHGEDLSSLSSSASFVRPSMRNVFASKTLTLVGRLRGMRIRGQIIRCTHAWTTSSCVWPKGSMQHDYSTSISDHITCTRKPKNCDHPQGSYKVLLIYYLVLFRRLGCDNNSLIILRSTVYFGMYSQLWYLRKM